MQKNQKAMNKRPTVSIIVPTYNRAELLKRAIESVLYQTYDNIIEIIITDDGSTDNTKEIVEEFKKRDSRIIYSINTKYPHGPTGNKNNGLDLAIGEFIGILDDDDILLPTAISDLVEIYIKYGYKIIFGNCMRSDNNEFRGRHYNKDEEMNYEDMICGRYEGEYWGIIHRDILGNKRFVSETWGGESLFWYQLFKKNKGYYLHKAVKIYNVEPHENVSSKYHLNAERTFLNYKLLLEMYGKDLLQFCPKRFVKYALLAAYFAKLKGSYWLGIKYWIQSWKTFKLWWLKAIALPYFVLPLPKTFQVFIRKRLESFLKTLINR